MVYSYYLNGILSYDTAGLISALPFYFIGAVAAWLLTYLGHAIACSIFRVDGKEMGVSYNPIKNLSVFSALGVISFPLLGVGWTKPVRYLPESRGKTLGVAVGGPLFCFAVSFVFLFLYSFTTVPFLGSLTMGIASVGMGVSVFNLLPVPGLCGGVALASILPERAAEKWMKLFDFYPLFVTLFVILLARSEINTLVIEKLVGYMTSIFS